jgi:hypothetical protein
MTIDRIELFRLGVRLADVARGTGVTYQKVWRASMGEPFHNEDEAERVREFIERRRTRGSVTA